MALAAGQGVPQDLENVRETVRLINIDIVALSSPEF
jgi:hypothetical protein